MTIEEREMILNVTYLELAEKFRNEPQVLIKFLREEQKTSGAAFDNTVYESYDAWIETIRKQIKKSESTLTNIEFKKVELEAIQKYIA